MPFEDSLIGNNDFDPRAATESLIRQLSDIPPGGPVDVRALNTRLARKLGQPTPAPIEEPEPEQKGPLDFSAQAAPPPPTDVTDTSLDFSAQAKFPSPVDMPPAPPTSLSDYPVEFGKGAVEGAKNMGASALKGTAALGIPTAADPALLDQLALAPTMTPRQRAELMGTVLRGVSDRGLQMDYNAALRRIAQGGDPAAEIAALKPKFDANNASATQPVTEKPLYKAGQAVENYGKEALAPKPGFENSWTRDLGSGAGSMAAGVATSMIPGIGPVAAGTLFTTAGSGEAVDNAVKGGATPQQTRQAAMLGGVAGATDLVDALLPMLGSTGKAVGFIKRMGVAAVKGALMEGGQEGVQQLMQNAIAKGIYKPDQDLFEDVPRSVAIAAILGGAGGGLSGAAHRGGDHAAPAPADAAAPGTTPGTGPGTPPPGGPQSSPEDIADFVRQARESAPPSPEAEPAPAADPSTMSEAERMHAYTASRESHGGASETDILKAAGLDPAAMDEQERIDAVIRSAKPADATNNATGNAQAQPEQSSEQPQAKQPEPASHQEYAVLREYGYSDEDIANMGAKQRAREVKDAYVNGIDPAKAMQKHKAPAPETADTTASKNTTEQPASATTSSPDKVVSEPGDGTREAPINAATADDVLKAKPTEPTEAQAKAENYKHAHVDLPQLGLTGKSNISIETGVGQERKGVSPDGKPWSVTLEHAAYGRIKGTKGADGEPLDIFVGPHPTSPHVFIVDQHHQTGGFDEHKILAGFRTPIDALHAYANSYTDGAKDRIGHVTAMGPEEFRAWLGGDTTKALRPASAEPSKAAEAGQTHTETAADTHSAPKEPSTTEARGESHSIISNPSSPQAAQKRDNKARPQSDEPLSLLQFIASKGGLAPHPELDALDIGDHRVHIPGRKGFFGVIRPTGMSLDLMREAAEESGYLRGEHNKTSTIRHLLDAIDHEMRGNQHRAEGEEGKTTKRQRTSAAESSAAARDQGIQANREAIAAEYVDLPDDLLEQAATIMADEMLDLDSAVEMAAVRAVNEDADYEVTPNDITDTFGEGAIDAIRAESTSEDGGLAPPASGQERQPDQGEEAGEHGERVPPARAEGREGEEVTAAEDWWKNDLTPYGKELAVKAAGLSPNVAKMAWHYIKPAYQEKLASIRSTDADPVSMRDAPTWAEVMAALPKDANGRPDMGVAKKLLKKIGGADRVSYRDLSPSQQVAMLDALKPAQTAIPGTEPIGDGELAQRKADTGLKPKVAQKPADVGLFGDEKDQTDLLDLTRNATDAIETALGDDADKVAPVDIARAAEIMADNPGMEPATAFGQAVIETSVDQGFITEQQAEESYGPEVKDVLDTGRQGASGGSAHLEQGGAESGEVGAGGEPEAGVVSRRGKAGPPEAASEGAGDDTAAAADTAEQSSADGQEGANGTAAEGADNPRVAKPRKPKKPSLVDRAENFYRPGRIVTGYSGSDRVLQFQRDGHYFKVEVVEVKDGNDVGRPRWHSTMPSDRDLAKWERDNPIDLAAGPKEPIIEAGESDGISPPVHGSDASSESEAVPPTAGQRGAGSTRGAESSGSEPDVSGADGGQAEDAASGTGSGGTGQGDAVRVSGRPESAEGGRGERADKRAARAVKGENYRIEPGALGEDRGPKTKATDNVQAIKLANRIIEESRVATAAEQHQLARYVGWGGIKNAFPDANGDIAKGFEQIAADLKDILTPEEYDTARRSIQYAHYTAEDVINGMWDIAERLGFKGGHVFEPGMGVGHFAGLMPADVAERTTYNGVEMDHVTARIAALLYPKWGVRREDFTKMPLAENAFDLAIGNPPFADVSIQSDPKYAKHKFLLHDYFFAKSLDAVRPGGVLAFVTSAGTMNKLDRSARNYLADRSDLVGAIRLPNNAFKRNAGTEVTTDILIFRKRLPGEAAIDRTWTETVPMKLADRDGTVSTVNVSRYFADHPEMILGEQGVFDTLTATSRYGVRARPGADLTAELAKAIDNLPRNVMSEPETQQARAEQDFEGTEKKDGSYYIKDGKLMQQRAGAGYEVERRGKGVEGGKTAAELERIRGLVPIRDALRETFAADLADDAEAGKRARGRLNKAYDAFMAKFGPINKAEIQKRRPNSIQEEAARAEAREDARYAGQMFDEGTFDASRMDGRSLTEIARARKAAIAEQGERYRSGDFDPDLMPDVIIDKRPNIDPFIDDQESYRLRAMEQYDEPTGKAAKRDVFFKNVISKDRPPEIKSVNDAALYVLNQKGALDLDAIGALVGKSRTETIEALGDRIYQVPGTQETFETNEKYLSGNVRKKLAIAKAAAEKNPIFRRNVAALDAAQPAPLAPSQIGASLGMPWIPTDVVEQFATEALGLEKLKAHYTPAIASWSVSGDTDSLAATSTWGTSRRNATALIGDALNRQNPRINDIIDDKPVLNTVATQAAQEKMQAIRDKFNEWVFADEKRADRLATFYNENYNNLVVQEFNGDYLTTPGISESWNWRPHQKRVVARIIQNGNTYVAHAVGAGKTSVYIGAGMEMRRLGLVKKPAYAVPNHMLAQFTKEFYEQYPTARIMVADERQFHTDRRKQFMANVAMSDLDAVIITHSAFGMIPVSNEFQDSIIQDELDEYRRALADMPKNFENRITRSRIEKQIERLEQRLSGKSNRKRDSVFTFDEMGIDFLFVDEAHGYRKLDFSTQMSNLKGITPQGSGMAWDLYVKSKLLDKRNPGRSLVLGSGTPVTNTMAELYTVSRYLQMAELRERQLHQFDAWAGAFGENVTELEQDAAGGYKPVSRFAKFVNVAELSAMVRQVMDVVTSRQLEQYVVRPKLKGGKRIMNLADKSPALDRYQASLAARMKAMQGRGKPKPGDDIMLKVIGDGRHAAIDMRLVGADKNDAEHPSKLDLLVENVAKLHKGTTTQKFYRPKNGAYDMSKPADTGPATQMIFVNLGISGSRGFSVPDYIRAELVRRGVPRTEIALIADYKSHVAKQKLFNDMNEGKVRVLIGSTAKMATGVNAQRRLYAVHNMDPLWYPSDDEQRNGRALRQGNMNPEIEIHDYSTKGTYDSTMWGMMEKKARFIQGFFEGDPSLRSMDDLGEASQYEQAKALTTNDPRLMRLTELRQELEKANRRKSAFDNERYAVRRRRAQAEDDIEHYGAREIGIEKDIAQRVPLAGDAFVAKIGRESFDKRVDFGEALLTVLDRISTPANSGRHMPIGEISGFSLVATPQKIADHMAVNVDLKRNGGAESHVTVGTSGLGAVRSMESILGGFDHDLAHVREKIKAARKFRADSETDAAKTFTGGGDMDTLASEIRDLQADLAKKEETPAPPPPPEDEGLASAMRAGDLTTTAAENIPVIEGMLASIVKKLAGNAIDVTFHMGGIPVSDVTGYGNTEVTQAAGMYYPHRSLIRLALYGGAEDVARTAFHESYHAIEDRFQTPAERELMRRETNRLREFLKRKGHKGYSNYEIDGFADYEIRAMAFEHYAFERSSGATSERAGEGIHIGARRWFERLWDALRSLANGLRGLGFRTFNDIFARAYSGEYAQREPGPPGGIDLDAGLASAIPPGGGRRGPPPVNETIAELLNNHNFDKLAGISKMLRFGNINATELRVRLQDRFIRVKKAEDSVGGVPTSQSAYQAETLYYGRTGQQLEALERNELDPLIEDMKARDIGLEEINEYLYAKHAPERNLAMDAINHPDIGIGGRDLRGRGSGMSDEEAQAIMDRITVAGRIADFEAVERRVRKIIDDSREQLVDSGLISQETADAWADQYEFYVPLQGFEEGTEDETMQGRGAGFDTRAGESKRAFGRLSRADGPLPYIMQQAELAIVRGEKNKVGNAWLRFVRSHPDPTRWTVDTPKLKKAIDPRTGLVTTVHDTNWHNDPDLFVTKVGGRPVLIRMEGTAGRNLVRALKNLGTENLNGFLTFVRGFTVTMSRLSTQWNPNFILPNMVRDLGEAYINLQAQDQEHFIKQFSKHIVPSIRGSFRGLRGRTGDRYSDAFHEYDAAGGRVRFFGIDNAVDVEKSITTRLRRLEGGPINSLRDAGRTLADGFEAVNGAVENATRLAAYMAARDVGMSIPDSANLALNLTVNFTKRGEYGPWMNALWMFANASVQGTRRTLGALSNKHVRRAAYGLIALGALSAMLAFGSGGDDDSGENYYSRVKDWERDKNLIIMWPKGFGHDGQYIKIPLPFLFGVFKVLGDRMVGVALGHDKPGSALWHVLSALGDGLNPLGEESSSLFSLAPSVLRPGLHILANKNWNGNPLYPTRDFEKNKPESEQSFNSNSGFAKGAAREINKASGGSPYKSGWADWHAGSIDHVMETLVGGLGKFVKDVAVTGSRIANGDPFDPTKAPIIRRFVGAASSPDADSASYYQQREDARKNGGDAIKNARKDRARGSNVEDAEKFLSENTNSVRGENIFKNADKEMKPLRDRKSRIEAGDSFTDAQRAEVADITARMRAIQNNARKQYRELKQGAP